MKCRCGCNKEAEFLMTGFDYDPEAPDKQGKQFIDEPACQSAMQYCREASIELGFAFEACFRWKDKLPPDGAF